MFEKTEETNLPLPDQLDEVRDKIKVLKAREVELSDQIKSIGGVVRGAFVEATVRTDAQKRLDTDKVKAELGDRLNDFYKFGEATKILLREIDPE
jgi:hypothetical protein